MSRVYSRRLSAAPLEDTTLSTLGTAVEECRPLVVPRQAPSYFSAEPRRLLPFSAAGRLSGRCASPSHCGSGGLHACPHPPLTHDPSTARAQDVGSL
jgi:hypothetical protein